MPLPEICNTVEFWRQEINEDSKLIVVFFLILLILMFLWIYINTVHIFNDFKDLVLSPAAKTFWTFLICGLFHLGLQATGSVVLVWFRSMLFVKMNSSRCQHINWLSKLIKLAAVS